MSTKGGPVLTFLLLACQGDARPVAPLSFMPLSMCHILLSRLTKKSQHQFSHKITTAVWRLAG